jgi:hypothetical protein
MFKAYTRIVIARAAGAQCGYWQRDDDIKGTVIPKSARNKTRYNLQAAENGLFKYRPATLPG